VGAASTIVDGNSIQGNGTNLSNASSSTIFGVSAAGNAITQDTLRHNGTDWVRIKNNQTTTAPGTGDDNTAGYSIGSRWHDTVADNEYVALDVSTGAAVWKNTTSAAGSGDVTGPASATDNAIARFDGTGGKTIQNSGVTISDNNEMRHAGTVEWDKGADIASTATLPLGTDGNTFDVTGTTTITAVSAKPIGTRILLQFDAALTLTHNATTLILHDARNWTTKAGDYIELISYDGTNWAEVSRSAHDIRHLEVTATADTTTSSTTYATVNSMTHTTPPAGDYLAIFNASLEGTGKAEGVDIAIHLGGTIVQTSERTVHNMSGHTHNTKYSIVSMAVVAMTGSNSVDVQWRRAAGSNTATMYERTFILIRLRN
jgi:hypothetical protein